MKLVSTRSAEQTFTFSEALLLGIAPDGGLFVPVSWPQLPKRCFEPSLTFQERSLHVLNSILSDELTNESLENAVKNALNFPLLEIPLPEVHPNIRVLELFHGPTLSFKDFGARMMAAFTSAILPKNKSLTILTATSGDTGSAVADAFSGQPNIRVVLLYPKGKVSALQELQLCIERPGVTTFAIDGTFDDCQKLVKTAFPDPDLKHLNLGSANSINIGRLLPQMLYYIHASSQQNSNRRLTVCVPSGNLGNISAAFMAKIMGAPLFHFVAAHNANAPFTEFLKTGIFSPTPTKTTISNAMDVGNPSNFERLQHFLTVDELQTQFSSYKVTEEDIRNTMLRVFKTGYVADPHTAVGIFGALQYLKDKNTNAEDLLIAGTASPAKFPDIVEAVTKTTPKDPKLEKLRELQLNVMHSGANYSTFKKALLKTLK